MLVTAGSGTVATSYTDFEAFETTDRAATGFPILPYLFSIADQGVHTFTGLIFNTSGEQTITVLNGHDANLDVMVNLSVSLFAVSNGATPQTSITAGPASNKAETTRRPDMSLRAPFTSLQNTAVLPPSSLSSPLPALNGLGATIATPQCAILNAARVDGFFVRPRSRPDSVAPLQGSDGHVEADDMGADVVETFHDLGATDDVGTHGRETWNSKSRAGTATG
jgi:hypothetical protein